MTVTTAVVSVAVAAALAATDVPAPAVLGTALPSPALAATANDRPRAHQVIIFVFEKMAVVDVCRREHGAAARDRRDRIHRRGEFPGDDSGHRLRI
ncbi:hypothetical protein [Streptomyces sp. RPA4-5]|uniref:hypothetical protein n=1 Tax=Streptomyces sp. RPA4-5 TaxID=2721245 RepID=UPI002001DEBF|nr:hypothetical protein [Streptomyces sp. RPA4-5]